MYNQVVDIAGILPAPSPAFSFPSNVSHLAAPACFSLFLLPDHSSLLDRRDFILEDASALLACLARPLDRAEVEVSNVSGAA